MRSATTTQPAVGPADDMPRVEMQMHAAGHFQVVARDEKAGMGEDQLGRQHAAGQELLRTVEVGQDRVEHGDPLREGFRQAVPLFVADDERKRVEFPGPVGPLRCAEDVVGDAVFAKEAAGLLAALIEAGRTEPLDAADEPRPGFAQPACRAAALRRNCWPAVGSRRSIRRRESHQFQVSLNSSGNAEGPRVKIRCEPAGPSSRTAGCQPAALCCKIE